MISEASQKAIEAAGLSFILGMKIPDIPCVVAQWRREHPGEGIPDGHVFTQPWPAGPKDKRWDQVIYYQYRMFRRVSPACGGGDYRRSRAARCAGSRRMAGAPNGCSVVPSHLTGPVCARRPTRPCRWHRRIPTSASPDFRAAISRPIGGRYRRPGRAPRGSSSKRRGRIVLAGDAAGALRPYGLSHGCDQLRGPDQAVRAGGRGEQA
jgi:hypothetical protein